ncbi:MAG TPA: sulfotransferase [Verrucomicrobiota bacterium]|nr:sulfotransferase [Verrucomicrobiota bacterium]
MSKFSPDIVLNADTLLHKAATQSRLSNFGDDAFHEPFEILLRSLRDEAQLNTKGVIMLQRTILRLLVNRLLTEQSFAEHPEMADTPIERPLYIIGFPRTGTTLLHNLLACDPASRWLRLWEGLHPAPAPESLENDPRIAATKEWVAVFEKLVPNLARAHKLNATGPEECLWLIEHTFADLIFELRANVPSYSKWLAEHEADESWYRYYRRQLQMLGWKCRGNRWICKAPRHLSGLGGLLGVFPDARIVQTHRGPENVLPSICSLCEITQSAASDAVDKLAIGAHWHQRLLEIERRSAKVRAAADPGQFFDVQYADLVANPTDTVRRIYEHHGCDYSEEFEDGMKHWLTGNRQHKHGAHRYSLEEYGLDADTVRTDFAGTE